MHTTNRREVWDQEQLGGDVIGPVGIMKRSEQRQPRRWGWVGRRRTVSALNITLELAASCPGRWAAGLYDGQRRRIGQEAPT